MASVVVKVNVLFDILIKFSLQNVFEIIRIEYFSTNVLNNSNYTF